MISLQNVSVVFDRRPIISNLSLDIPAGDHLLITGPNGRGKTTLLRLILKLLRPTSGRVLYLDAQGREVKAIPSSYLPQKSAIDSRFPITVAQCISQGFLGDTDAARTSCTIEDALALFDLAPLARKPIAELSGGQLQRVLLTRALVARADLLLLDEPLSYLDTPATDRLISLLADLPPTTTLIVVSHDLPPFLSNSAFRQLPL